MPATPARRQSSGSTLASKPVDSCVVLALAIKCLLQSLPRQQTMTYEELSDWRQQPALTMEQGLDDIGREQAQSGGTCAEGLRRALVAQDTHHIRFTERRELAKRATLRFLPSQRFEGGIPRHPAEVHEKLGQRQTALRKTCACR